MKKAVKLRSIYFPFYALLALDWKRFLPMIPIHLAVTGLVLLLTLKCSKAEVKNTLKGSLLPAFGAGFLGDACGVFFRFLPLLLELVVVFFEIQGVARGRCASVNVNDLHNKLP